jgi:hypothetical protein
MVLADFSYFQRLSQQHLFDEDLLEDVIESLEKGAIEGANQGIRRFDIRPIMLLGPRPAEVK